MEAHSISSWLIAPLERAGQGGESGSPRFYHDFHAPSPQPNPRSIPEGLSNCRNQAITLIDAVARVSWRWVFARVLALTGPPRKVRACVLIKFLFCLAWTRVR